MLCCLCSAVVKINEEENSVKMTKKEQGDLDVRVMEEKLKTVKEEFHEVCVAEEVGEVGSSREYVQRQLKQLAGVGPKVSVVELQSTTDTQSPVNRTTDE